MNSFTSSHRSNADVTFYNQNYLMTIHLLNTPLISTLGIQYFCNQNIIDLMDCGTMHPSSFILVRQHQRKNKKKKENTIPFTRTIEDTKQQKRQITKHNQVQHNFLLKTGKKNILKRSQQISQTRFGLRSGKFYGILGMAPLDHKLAKLLSLSV